jgi:hypothetical protein
MPMLPDGTVLEVKGKRVQFIKTGPVILPPAAQIKSHPDCEVCVFSDRKYDEQCFVAPCGGGYFKEPKK